MLNPEAVNGPYPAPYLRNADVQWDRINTVDLPEMSFSADERLKFALRRGDILVCEGGEVGRAAMWRGKLSTCLYQKALHRLRPLRATEEPRFLVYVLRAAVGRGVFEAEGNRSTIYHLTAEKLRAHRLPFPPLDRQRSIAAFLDRKTAAIDQLIERKEHFVALLEEKRQALITHAVTKGLDPSVPMKESGCYWLGPIPANWALKRNAVLFQERDERGRRDLPVLSVSLATGVELRDFSEDRIQPKMADFEEYKVAARGDIVFNKMRMWQGAVGVAPMDGFVSPDYTVLTPSTGANALYFTTLFRTAGYTCEVSRFSHGIALDRNRIYWDAFKSLVSPVPPRVDQDAIAVRVSSIHERLGGSIRELEQSVSLLREYRQALIYAAVTGQIDVSNEAA